MSAQSPLEVLFTNLARNGFFMVTTGLIGAGSGGAIAPSSRHVNTPRVPIGFDRNLASSLIVLFRVKCLHKEELWQGSRRLARDWAVEAFIPGSKLKLWHV